MNQNYTYFLSDRQKIYFLVCLRIVVIRLCVPWDEQGWKSLVYNYTYNIDEFHKHNIGQKKQNTKQHTLHEFFI